MENSAINTEKVLNVENVNVAKDAKALNAKQKRELKKKNSPSVPADQPIKLGAKIDQKMLDMINSLGIKERSTNGSRSIFKKEFNNKNDRTKCRNQFQNAISLFLLHISKGKKELANESLLKAKEIADKYYVAESKFLESSAYCTDNMQDDKKNLIKGFIEVYNKLHPTKK